MNLNTTTTNTIPAVDNKEPDIGDINMRKINKDKKILSIIKAVNTINSRDYCFINIIQKRMEDKGVIIVCPIDFAAIESERLRFRKFNNCESISVSLADVANIFYRDEYSPDIHFELTNGEELVARLCGGESNYSQQIESYKEIDGDEFIERLHKCRKVSVSQSIEHLSCQAVFDTVNINYPGFDDDEEEVKLILTDSANPQNDYNIGISSGTKFHIACENSDFDIVFVSLCEMPLLSKLCLTLFYNED